MHYGTHMRNAFYNWLDEGCPPAASVEVHYQPQVWPAERLLRKMLNCSDIIPGHIYQDATARFGLERSRKQTCGSVARILLDERNKLTTA